MGQDPAGIGWRELLADEGLIVAQIHPKEFASLDLRSFQLADQRKYGSTLLCFYELV